MSKFRKKPVVIDAIKLIGGTKNIKDILEFMGQKVDTTFSRSSEEFDNYCSIVNKTGLIIKTLEGTMIASIGDYVIKGVNGEFYPCKPDIFEKTYEAVE